MCTVGREGGVGRCLGAVDPPTAGPDTAGWVPLREMEQITIHRLGGTARQRLPTTLGPAGTGLLNSLPEHSVAAHPGRSVRVCVHTCTNSPRYYSIKKLGGSNQFPSILFCLISRKILSGL